MVATNEFEDAWMDEGINSYTEVKVLDSILGENTSILNIAGATLWRTRAAARLLYQRQPIAIPWPRTPTTTSIRIPMPA